MPILSSVLVMNFKYADTKYLIFIVIQVCYTIYKNLTTK